MTVETRLGEARASAQNSDKLADKKTESSLFARFQDPVSALHFILLSLSIAALTAGCASTSGPGAGQTSQTQKTAMSCDQAEVALLTRYRSCRSTGIASTCFHLLWDRFTSDFPQCAQDRAATTCIQLCVQDGAPSHCRQRCSPSYVKDVSEEANRWIELRANRDSQLQQRQGEERLGQGGQRAPQSEIRPASTRQ